MRIRAPEEFADGGVSNQFRPANVDASAATSFVREARTSLREIGSIVDAAHDNALRSQALADSVEYETRLTALRAEMDNEAPPDGTDETDWARTYPQRWQQRSTTIRDDVSRRRGRRSNAYLRYFDERANQIAGREQNGAIERSQAAIVDIDRAAGMELLATFAAGATNPDLPETVEGDGPSRARYVQQYIDHARELARRGTWSHQFAAERITQLTNERQTFLETEGRFSQSRTNADRIRGEHPGDQEAQLAAAAEIENPRERELTTQMIVSDNGRERDARQGNIMAARSRIETLINRHGPSWERYAQQADLELVRSDPGAMAQIRGQLDALLDPTGSTAASRGVASARNRVLFEDLSNSSDPTVGAAFVAIDLDTPLTERDAAALRAAGFADAQEGTVLSASLSREDYAAVVDMQRARRSGVAANGDMISSREVDDVVGYAIANGLADFGSDDDAATRRENQQLFRAFVGQIIRDDFARGGARDLSPAEVASIARLALNRTGQNGRNNNAAPLYRRRTDNRVQYNQIPSGVALRIRQSLPPAQTAGLSTEQIDALVVDAYARENRHRAQGR